MLDLVMVMIMIDNGNGNGNGNDNVMVMVMVMVRMRSCMLDDFSLSDKSELFPLNPVKGSSTFSSSTSCIIMYVKIILVKIVGIFSRSFFSLSFMRR